MTMTDRERKLAVLNYESYDRLPVVHFGFWRETLLKWAAEGHLSEELAKSWGDGNAADAEISALLGFDSNWSACIGVRNWLFPSFEHKVIKELPDGSNHYQNGDGVILLGKPEAGSIPSEIGHLLTDRASWEEHYKWRFEWSDERVDHERLAKLAEEDPGTRERMLGVNCGSLVGRVRNVLGIEGLSYLQVDDPELFEEIIATSADLCHRSIMAVLDAGVKVDFGHFWEDICFKNGPLISPRTFKTVVGPHYKRITELLNQHGINIVSVDCDGCIDALVGTWLENGVNTMFPIEVGTWNASIAPWREQYGKELRGVGGMNKCLFARDKAAIDAEVERLKPLVELGGFIPCPDHRIAPDAKWELVRYYCDTMKEAFA